MFNDFDNAIQLIAAGKLEEAIKAFESMLLDDPKNADVLFNLGMCFTDIWETIPGAARTERGMGWGLIVGRDGRRHRKAWH